MKYSEIKEIRELVGDEWREAVESIEQWEKDFEVGNYRFINADDIDEILGQELADDTEHLGCFNASFIAEATNLPLPLIEVAQEAEKFGELGELMLPHIGTIVEKAVGYDGYGHHFAHYDFNEHEIAGGEYYAFRIQ